MVRKEVGMHLLAYNLIRGVMAEAARGRDVQPRELSFNGARQTVRAFEETHLYEPKQIAADFPLLLDLISPETRRRSTGPIRASCNQAPAEALPTTHDATSRSQDADRARRDNI